MLSSSTYLNYINKLKINKQIYVNLLNCIKGVSNNINLHTDNLNIVKNHFENGYVEDNGTIFTGDLIINACKSSNSISKQVNQLLTSINNEILKINSKSAEYNSLYIQALRIEREREEARKAAQKKLGINS